MDNIPNELKIIINTSVPGYQKIIYKPYMNVQDLKNSDNTVIFDPLVKLNQSIINKVPENLRKKQFFNKGLFQSLINYINAKPVKNLFQATKDGYIDNNIKITLDTLLPSNSIFYINKNPYVIVDTQWTKGDWKIDTKKKISELRVLKTHNPYINYAIIQDEIISGEKELKTIPNNIIYGENYDGPKDNTAKGINTNKSSSSSSNTLSTQTDSQTNTPKKQQVSEIKTQTNNLNNTQGKEDQVVPYVNNTTNTNTNTNTVTDTKTDINKKPLEITNFPTNTNTNNSTPLLENGESSIVPEQKLELSDSTYFVRNYFINKEYYFMINLIYQHMDDENKKNVNKLFKNPSLSSTNHNLSYNFYKETVNGLNIQKNNGGGNCFFIAVSDGINYYNYKNSTNKIISGNYGNGNKIFTPSYLRSLVADYILESPHLNQFLDISEIYCHDLNEKFENEIKAIQKADPSEEITSEKYLQIAENIYGNFKHFLVKKPTSVPFDINDYYTPFQPLKANQIKQYINSNEYWANETAFKAVKEKLKLNIIPLERDTKNNICIPFAELTKQDDQWDKYMFIYSYNNHFELITFNYINNKKIVNNNGITIKKYSNRISIFNKNKLILAPLYILFLIYGCQYYNKSYEYKTYFDFFNFIMKLIDKSVNYILKNDVEQKKIFMKLLKNYFPQKENQENKNNLLTIENNNIENENKIGGYYNKSKSTNFPKYNAAYNDDYKSQLCYVIQIDMELHPGTSLSPEEYKNIKCRQQWNAVRKSYAEFTGNPYVIPPVYETKPTNKNKNNNKTYKRNKSNKKNKTYKNYKNIK
jgi:hypothetical protein